MPARPEPDEIKPSKGHPHSTWVKFIVAAAIFQSAVRFYSDFHNPEKLQKNLFIVGLTTSLVIFSIMMKELWDKACHDFPQHLRDTKELNFKLTTHSALSAIKANIPFFIFCLMTPLITSVPLVAVLHPILSLLCYRSSDSAYVTLAKSTWFQSQIKTHERFQATSDHIARAGLNAAEVIVNPPNIGVPRAGVAFNN